MRKGRIKQRREHHRVAPRLTALARKAGIASDGKQSLEDIFQKLATLLKKNERGLCIEKKVIGSVAKGNKRQIHLYGGRVVSILGRKPQRTYIAGVVMQKNFVGFYVMPMYSHSQLAGGLSSRLKRMKKGKSCFNVTVLSNSEYKELETLVRIGITQYRKERWI